MPAPVAPLTDSELCDLLTAPPVRRAAAEELMRRHGEAVLACAGVLCGDRQSAETLTVEAFNRALDVFDHGPVPDLTWLSFLVGEARRLAARWADDGRADRLSPAFAGWLDRQRHGTARTGSVAALRTAEHTCPLLRALHRLPDAAATEVWHSLLPAPGAGAPAAPVRQELAMAYLRERNSLVAERLCRHLAVRLADAASDGHAADPELTGHLGGCEPCARALADLRAVHRWDLAQLRTRALLDHWEPGPQTSPTTGAEHTVNRPGPGPAPVLVGAGPRPPGHRRRRRSARHARKPRTAAFWAAGLGTLTLACALTPVLTAPDRERTAPSVPTRPEGPGTEPAPTSRTATPTPSTPAPPTPTSVAGRPAVRSPGPPASP
ncbi:hypothetical protein WN990_38530 [Kitasatospora purpeofusca]|uniref:hypothetical protein n=1 Tax=Kitasatospora purpeofusca TaxID=67352 RepID=UPI0030F23935